MIDCHPRKHCRPKQSQGRQCFPRDENLPCHPFKNEIFILLNRVSHFYNKFQCYMITDTCSVIFKLFLLISLKSNDNFPSFLEFSLASNMKTTYRHLKENNVDLTIHSL